MRLGNMYCGTCLHLYLVENEELSFCIINNNKIQMFYCAIFTECAVDHLLLTLLKLDRLPVLRTTSNYPEIK